MRAKKVAKERKLIRKRKMSLGGEEMGPDSAEEFLQLLKKRFGSICRGWRSGMCELNNTQMKLGFTEFCQAARNLGYGGNMKQLFRSLDVDKSGHISLADVDPEAHTAMSEFKAICKAKYGNIVDCWKKSLDGNRNGRLELDEFVGKCKEFGYKRDPKKLFGFFLLQQGHQFLTMRDLDPAMQQNLYSGHHELVYAEKPTAEERRNMNFLERQELSMTAKIGKWMGKEKKEKLKKSQQEEKEKLIAATSIGGFTKMLVHRYGSVARGWRKGLDKDGNGRLSYNEFASAARAIGYAGNIKVLWACLGGEATGTIPDYFLSMI